MKCEICNKEDAVILLIADKEGERKPACKNCYNIMLRKVKKENDKTTQE